MPKKYKHSSDSELSASQRKLQEQQELEDAYKSGTLFEPVDTSRNAQILEPLWGNWIVRNTLVIQSGVGGISKTSFNWSLLMGLQRDGEFLDVPGRQDIKVLYFDYEGSKPITKARLNLLGELERDHPYFYVCNHLVPVTQIEKFIDRFIEDWWTPDIIVFDPFSLALEMESENDNVEATNKMKYMRECMRKWNSTFIIVHHSSKADVWGVGNARGAGAQGNLSDIVWEYHPLPKEFGDDTFVLRIPKNREISDGFLQCIRKAEGTFVACDFPVGFNKDTLQSTGIEVFRMQQRIEVIMQDGKPRDLGGIIDKINTTFQLEVEHDTKSPLNRMIYRAITPLLQKNILMKVGRGIYVAAGNLK